ncbi:MAG: hypothetical protein NTV06_01045, partial [candidate division Zixibacteria bacterium]|nr:hypothetical protein [candidate division Zixibacteria bacterium]
TSGPRILFKSRATPPAKIPISSIRCAKSNFSCSFFFSSSALRSSVTSAKTPIPAVTSPC